MKCHLLKIFVAIAIMALGSVSALAEILTGSCGSNATYTLDTETGLLKIEGSGEMEFYSTSIPTPWKELRNKIITVEISGGITSVSNYAFYGCESLTKIVLPASLKRIGGRAFASCSSISSIAIPNSVTSIGEFAFSGCSNLESVTIPASVTSIEAGTFSVCLNLASVTICSSVKKIGEYAFSQCPSLTTLICEASTPPSLYNQTVFYGVPTYLATLYVPAASTETYKNTNGWDTWNTLKEIGQDVLTGSCGDNITYILDTETGLLKIEGFGEMLNFTPFSTSIPWYSYRSSIRNVQLSEGISSVGNYAFYMCTELSSVNLPNSVKKIGLSAFQGCHRLLSAIIGDMVTTIGEEAFYGCSEMTTVSIGKSVVDIGNHAFDACRKLSSVVIPKSVVSIGSYAFQNCTELSSVSIGNSVTTIGDGAFGFCIGLKSMGIPNSVTYMGNYVFQGCEGLTTVSIGDSVSSIGNATFSGCNGVTSITIPNSVTEIGEYAFKGCSGMLSLTIGNSVTNIGKSAFCGCSGLTSIHIPESVIGIGDHAFQDCRGLSSITIPDFVVSIGDYAFLRCSGLKEVCLGNSLSYIGNQAFDGCSELTSINIGNENAYYSSIDGILFDSTKSTLVRYPLAKTGRYDIPNTVRTIWNYAFKDCVGLVKVVLPNSISNIKDYAFSGCIELKSVNMGSSITSIGSNAFYGCNNVNDITWNAKNFTNSLPNSLTENIVTLIIGDSVTTIYDLFKRSKNIQNIVVGKNVSQIRSEAFGDCSKLKSVISYNKIPPFCYPNVFKNKPANAMLKVYDSVAETYCNADQWKDFVISVISEFREEMLNELDSFYKECAVHNFLVGTENGQYGKDEVDAFNNAKDKVSAILANPEEYTNNMIQAALDELKSTYQAVLDSKVDKMIIVDECSLNIDKTEIHKEITYIRTFYSSNWEPLCIPLAMRYEEWSDYLEIADINNVHQYDMDADGVMDVTELEIAVLRCGILKPNALYLVRAIQPGECRISVANGVVYPTMASNFNVSNRRNTYTFYGNYVEQAFTNIYTLENGELVLNTTTNIQPQRWYMTITPRGTANADMPTRIRIRTTEDYVDGIAPLTPDLSPKSGETYDLQGRKVQKAQKGLFIQDGKKVAIK